MKQVNMDIAAERIYAERQRAQKLLSIAKAWRAVAMQAHKDGVRFGASLGIKEGDDGNNY